MKTKMTILLSLLLLLLPFFGHAQWSTDRLSEARWELAACKVGDQLLFAGGFRLTPFGHSKRVDIYHTATGTWSVDSLSEARDEMAAAASGSLAFFVGSSGIGSIARVMDIYDASTGTWQQETLPKVTGLKSIVISGDQVFVAGGDYIDIYDIPSEQWLDSHPLDRPRGLMAAVSMGDKVLFAGGFDGYLADRLNTVDIYDRTTDQWTQDSLSQDRSGVAAVVLDNKAYFAGGVKDDYDVSDRIDVYDGATGTWTTASLGTPRSAIAAVVIRDRLFFVGGRGNNGEGNFDLIEIYDPRTDEWRTDQLSEGRHSMGAVVDGDRAYFAGGDLPIGASDLVDIYDATLTGLTPVAAGGTVSVFPNPATDYCYLDLPTALEGQTFELVLYAADGRLVRQMPQQITTPTPVATAALEPGVYLLELRRGAARYTGRLVVE
ncbi:MAG: kelch repeat-containing protein [Bacteroidota bacterium]